VRVERGLGGSTPRPGPVGPQNSLMKAKEERPGAQVAFMKVAVRYLGAIARAQPGR
jgi:hypothetical protein